MGVPELWRFDGQRWQVLKLENTSYQEVSHSPTFPWIEKEDLDRFLAQARIDEVEAELNFRKWVRDRLASMG